MADSVRDILCTKKQSNPIVVRGSCERIGERTGRKGESSKKSWFKGLKAEFNKIIWPDKETVGKADSCRCRVCSVALGLIIAAPGPDHSEYRS
ncbi:MAG: preprotein translocase subunit SecE [Lachnospiraceae bacterium]